MLPGDPRIRSRLYDCGVCIDKTLQNAYPCFCNGVRLDGTVCLHRNPRSAMAVPALRRMVLGKVVVQQGLPSQALCPLRIAEVWIACREKTRLQPAKELPHPLQPAVKFGHRRRIGDADVLLGAE